MITVKVKKEGIRT